MKYGAVQESYHGMSEVSNVQSEMLVIKSKKKWSEWETMIISNKSNLYIICRQAAVTKEKFCLPFVYITTNIPVLWKQ